MKTTKKFPNLGSSLLITVAIGILAHVGYNFFGLEEPLWYTLFSILLLFAIRMILKKTFFNRQALVLLGVLTVGLLSCQHAKKNEIPPESSSNQFDFWLGEWDVNLRVKQKDHSWKDMHTSIARIYPVLNGSAVLELWEEQNTKKGIVGYSIRYYDTLKDKWILWLNWPGTNYSGSVKLEGEFRHGRVEFFGSEKMNDSTDMQFRYTFSDIQENSLRWDNAMSTDGGKSWSGNWIMEFQRKKKVASPMEAGRANLTNHKLDRCTLEPFEYIKTLGEKKIMQGDQKSITWFGILEGCAVISLLTSEEFEELSVLTYNTDKNQYEELVMNTTKPEALVYYGERDGTILKLKPEGKPDHQRTIIHKKDNYIVIDSKGSEVREFEFGN